MQIEENIPLAQFTTFNIGGLAKFLARAQDIEALRAALVFAKEKNIKTLILGGGSNVLIDDAGFDGLVIKIELAGISREKNLLIAAAGESWDALVARAVEERLWGVENLSGIPGTVGGAVAGNIGAYGQALSQTLVWAEVFDSESGEVKKIHNADCAFGYRESIFSLAKNPTLIILRAAFDLSPNPKPDVSYKDLAARFNDSSLDLSAIRAAVLDIRKAKFPDLAVEGTAGSFFKNPIMAVADAQKLKETYPDLPIFAMPETAGAKIPLAWLLDHVLGMRGAREGGARLYEKQPLVIVAEKNCTGHDVRALAERVQKEVKEKINIIIEPEVKIIL